MNKLVIPTILLTTVMVAGIFAFSPVEQVSTVHTTIITEIGNQDRTIVYHNVFTGSGPNGAAGDVTTDLIALVLQSENAYAGEVNIVASTDDDDGFLDCDATFTVDVDTNNDGASDLTVSTAAPNDGNAYDTDPLPNGVDQIFVNTNALSGDVENICDVTVVLLLTGTET